MSVVIKGIDMPQCCDECWALDERGDYPYCLITGETEGYTFNIRKYKMDRCLLGEGPTPLKGEWIGKPISGFATVRCSQCKEVYRENTGKWNFCPNCGADMRGDVNGNI